MKGKRKPNSSPIKTGKLAALCIDNPTLSAFFKPGLSAVKNSERDYIKVPDTKLLGGCVALDEAAKKSHPHDNRWDYALEYADNTFFIEIHPASTSEIDCVIQKVDFVKRWLNDIAPGFLDLPKKENGARQFYWVSSGSTDLRILPGSQQARKLALRHIISVGKIWDYSKLFK